MSRKQGENPHDKRQCNCGEGNGAENSPGRPSKVDLKPSFEKAMGGDFQKEPTRI